VSESSSRRVAAVVRATAKYSRGQLAGFETGLRDNDSV